MNDDELMKKLFENPKAELSITDMQPGHDYLSTLALAIENTFNEQGWDQRPLLLAVTDGSGGEPEGENALVLMSAEEIPLPEPVLDEPNPGLPLMADEIVKITRKQLEADIEAGRRSPIEGHFIAPWLEGFSGQLGVNWAGIAFVYEGWTVKRPAEDPQVWSDEEVASAAEYAAAVMTKGLHEHPDRIEMRGVYFEGVDGRQIMVTRNRDAEPEVMFIGKDGADRITGAIPNAIHVFVVIGKMLMIRRGYHRP